MKKAKQVLSILLAALMIALSMSAITATAANEKEITVSGTCGNNITWKIEKGTLTVSGTGAIKPLTRQEEEIYTDYEYNPGTNTNEPVEKTRTKTVEYFPWDFDSNEIRDAILKAYGFDVNATYTYDDFMNNRDTIAEMCAVLLTLVQTIRIDEGITTIPANAFCFYPQFIDLPSTIDTVEEGAFNCEILKDLYVRNSYANFERINIKIRAYDEQETPFTSYEEMVNAEIDNKFFTILFVTFLFEAMKDDQPYEYYENKWSELLSLYESNENAKKHMEDFQFGKEPKINVWRDGAEPETMELVTVDGTPVSWLTIHAENGSTAQAAANTSKVKFVPFEDGTSTENPSTEPKQEEGKEAEKKTGIAAFFQRIVEIFRNLFNSIKKLFG